MSNHVATRSFLGTAVRLMRSWGDTLAEIARISAAPKLDPVIGRQRNTLILSRCRHLAALLLPLTMIWSIIDALVLPTGLWGTLAVARFAVAGVFLGIATSSANATDARSTDTILMALYGVPNAFFLFANLLLAHFNLDERSSGLATTYFYAPFIMAAGIGFFPLTLMESGIILTQLLLVAAITGLADTAHASFFSSIAHVWLLFLVGIVGAFSAMSQLQSHAQTIEKSARDALTGLITRGVGTEILGSQIQMARRKRVPLTVLFVDLDHFKRVNDAFGHDCGDSVLATAARQLRTVFRKQDVLIRWGGEEFLIVCPETDEAHAITAIERLTELGLGCLPDGSPQTASIGIAELDLSNPSSDPITLVASADRRMYRAKQAGRNRIAMSNGDMRGFLTPRHGEPSTHGAKRILAE